MRPGLLPPCPSPSPPGISKACEQNFRKTLQFGGRSLFPSSMELKAMVVRPGAHGQGFRSPPPTKIWDDLDGFRSPPKAPAMGLS